jgi:hypothetical protein
VSPHVLGQIQLAKKQEQQFLNAFYPLLSLSISIPSAPHRETFKHILPQSQRQKKDKKHYKSTSPTDTKMGE